MIQFVRRILQSYADSQKILNEMGIIQIPSPYGYSIYVDEEQMAKYHQALKDKTNEHT